MAEDTIDGMFVNTGGTAFCEVVEVNETFARLEIRNKGGLSSSYAMPITQYDEQFSTAWHPATLAEAREFFTPSRNYRPPRKGWS